MEVFRFLKFLHFSLVISLKTKELQFGPTTRTMLGAKIFLPQPEEVEILTDSPSAVHCESQAMFGEWIQTSTSGAMLGCLDAPVTMPVTVSVVSDWMLV